MKSDRKYWVIKSIHTDGTSAFVYDKDDGITFVPRYSTRARAVRKNQWAFRRNMTGEYVVKRSRLSKIEAFERMMNEKTETAHARKIRARENDVAKCAEQRLKERRWKSKT